MFDQLVVSSRQRRRHTTGKFFLMTSALYVFAIASAFAVSILVSNPRLADTSEVTHIIPVPPMIGGPRKATGPPAPATTTPPPDYRNVEKLETLLSHHGDGPPPLTTLDPRIGDPGLGGDGPAGPGIAFGVIGGDAKTDPPPRPDPPKPKPVVQATPDQRPLRVVSQILQGKAIERAVPGYPELAKKVRLQGDVSVEVIVSPDGRVESARAVSGHPMLASAAVDAARRWRFGPTLLNGVPVRVTGVIVFVFRLNE